MVVDATPASTGAERNVGILTIMSGQEMGRVVSLPAGKTLDMGRSPDAWLSFDEASVSGTHAQIVRFGAAYMFADAKSTNGSFVNDQRVTGPVTLNDGDRVQLGLSTTLRFSLVTAEEEAALRATYESGRRDGLTGVYNRKHLEERLEAEVTAAARIEAPLSLIMIDVDHFKKVNDTYGHLGGDAVLRAVGAVLNNGIRKDDLVARYGGEEFTILAKGIDVRIATSLAERLRQAICLIEVPFEGKVITVTSSAGVSSLAELDSSDPKALLALADARLYKAKQAGRNRVVAS